MNGLLPEDVAVGDILVTVSHHDHELSFLQIVGYTTKSGRLRFIHLHVSKSIANRQITYRVKSNPNINGQNIRAFRTLKDGFLRLDGILLEKYDPTKIYLGNTPTFYFGSDDESDGFVHVDSDFDD
ncbi:MAG: hypothetical protein WD512_14995 [Candidatus Paceibacterota bacterium]